MVETIFKMVEIYIQYSSINNVISNPKFSNKDTIRFKPSNYDNIRIKMPQNFDLQLLRFKVDCKWLRSSGILN